MAEFTRNVPFYPKASKNTTIGQSEAQKPKFREPDYVNQYLYTTFGEPNYYFCINLSVNE